MARVTWRFLNSIADRAERLVRNADVALYRAKAGGRGRFSFYRPEMDRELRERRSLQRGLRRALRAPSWRNRPRSTGRQLVRRGSRNLA